MKGKIERTGTGNEKLNKMLKKIDKDYLKIKKTLKDGGVCLMVAIPELSAEEFEQWELGASIEKGIQSMYVGCTGRTLVTFYNILSRIYYEFGETHPEIAFRQIMSQMKSKMVINEEDLKDES